MKRSVLLLAVLALAGCKADYHFDPPDREARVEEAEGSYSSLRFDSITWSDDDDRLLTGNEIYASHCRNCHGTLGAGDTDYAAQRGLEVPSLVTEEWRYAGSIDSIRHRVFVGHASGMPSWGVAGITDPEIDAVAFYLLEGLRPDVVGR